MNVGKQSWIFENGPVIIASAAVGGPFEAKGALASDFDILKDSLWVGQDSFEKAEQIILQDACERAIEKSGLSKEEINFYISGDLMNQIISSNFVARYLNIPFFGIFGACSSAIEGLVLASFIVENKGAKNILTSASSHNASAERQFRYPTEYGGQKPPTAQWTVTGAGASIISLDGEGPRVKSATIGKVIDLGISDPFNMGAAMAPAACDTIIAHFEDLNREPDYYDLIATGDLGKVGFSITKELLKEKGFVIPEKKFVDCGLLIYKEEQQVFAGGSGCGCSAAVTYGHFMNEMKKGNLKKILIIGTGALMSPMSYQQKESIPSIAHAVSIEMK